jgi:hypothetical protein
MAGGSPPPCWQTCRAWGQPRIGWRGHWQLAPRMNRLSLDGAARPTRARLSLRSASFVRYAFFNIRFALFRGQVVKQYQLHGARRTYVYPPEIGNGIPLSPKRKAQSAALPTPPALLGTTHLPLCLAEPNFEGP